jgi:hypothetical protein
MICVAVFAVFAELLQNHDNKLHGVKSSFSISTRVHLRRLGFLRARSSTTESPSSGLGRVTRGVRGVLGVWLP